MLFADYHIHTEESFDGSHKAAEMLEAAVSAGLGAVALTDHCDLGSPEFYDSFDIDVGRQRRKFDAVAPHFEGRLDVRFGIELGQPNQQPAKADQILRENTFDFVLGSLHNLSGEKDFYFLDYHRLDVSKLLTRYFDELIEMVECDFDVLGHLTYPWRYLSEAGLEQTWHDFEEQIRLIYQRLIELGRGIEINTSGLRRSMGVTMPDLPLVRLFRELGGEIITVGSDAHEPAHVGAGIRQGIAIAREAGFTSIALYRGRRPQFVSITEE